MKLKLSIRYRTQWGEALHVVGGIPALGNGNHAVAPVMSLEGDDLWTLTLDLPDDTGDFVYEYIVRAGGGTVRREWHGQRLMSRGNGVDVFVVNDRWQDQPWDKPYYASAFTDCINNRAARQAAVVPVPGTVTLKVSAPMVRPGQVVAVCGETAALGSWDPAKAVRMSDSAFPEWAVVLDSRAIPQGAQYKFVTLDGATGTLVAWEGGENRRMGGVRAHRGEAVIEGGMRYVYDGALYKGAGTAIPVFALRSDSDMGVGDFADLKQMVDWAAMTGQSFVQILPINDTTMTGTWTDSYPYNANSTFALHPMYLRVQDMGVLKDGARMEHYRALARELNDLDEIDYERVNAAKGAYIREIFEQEGAKTLRSKSFKAFVAQNRYWLEPYAAFCVLRDLNGTPEFGAWGEMAVYDQARVDGFVKAHRRDIDLVCFTQYHLDRQLKEVRDYAHSRGVALKGDIPIGISRTSVDAWRDTRLFNMDCQAGAPPDDFSVLGQNWGFPTYNWEEMSKDGFAWWKARFSKMAEYFDAYRIDHVLGFFRIWQIPMNALHGLLGYFSPALPYSVDELRNNYDFWMDVDLYTTPYIMDWMLGDFFGEYTDEARERFLMPIGYGRYRMAPGFETQRKVAGYFAAQPKDERNNRLCNALLGLIDQVLFIEDEQERGKFHPRISAQFTYTYRSLNDYEKWCFDRLYNDFFYHRHNDFWYGKAMWKLPPLIDATDMLVCAEDLGMIPACVPAVMDRLEILALEIQRMPKDPKVEFGNTWSYPYYSVCTTSTHDMGGIRQWWEEDRERSQRFYNTVLGEQGAAPYYAEPWICARILQLHFASPSMLAIIPLADLLSMDGALRRQDPREEQINVPANPRHYWRYRMHMTLDALQGAEGFNNHLRTMLAQSGR